MLYERFHKILGIRTRVEMKTEIIEEMEKILKNFLERFGDHALLFSGGLDSSIIAWLLKQAGKETKLYTLCYNDESYDIIQSGKSAKLIGLKVKKVKFDENDVIEGAKLVKKILKTRVTSIDVSHVILAKNVEENTVISGQGADELFCGYAKYTKMDKNEREKGMREDFKNWVRTKKEAKIFGHFEKKIFFPYVELENIANRIEIEKKENKLPLRELALHIGLPEEIALQKKKALQYGSGVSKAFKKALCNS